jgi:hypothetical protein
MAWLFGRKKTDAEIAAGPAPAAPSEPETPQQQIRKWQRDIRSQQRELERRIRGTSMRFVWQVYLGISRVFAPPAPPDIERSETKVQDDIRKAAKRVCSPQALT